MRRCAYAPRQSRHPSTPNTMRQRRVDDRPDHQCLMVAVETVRPACEQREPAMQEEDGDRRDGEEGDVGLQVRSRYAVARLLRIDAPLAEVREQQPQRQRNDHQNVYHAPYGRHVD